MFWRGKAIDSTPEFSEHRRVDREYETGTRTDASYQVQSERRFPKVEEEGGATSVTSEKDFHGSDILDVSIEGSSSPRTYTPYASKSGPYSNPAAIATSIDLFSYPQNANHASFDAEPSEGYGPFDLPTPSYPSYPSYPRSLPTPAAIATSTNQFSHARNTNHTSFDDEPSEEHDKFDLPTPSYPRSFPNPAARFRDPNYPTGSMTDGLADLSLNSGKTTSSLSYGHEEEVVDDPYTNTVGKLIRRAPNSKEYEELDTRYRAIETKHLKKFWKVGRVFMMLWTEPARTGPLGGTRNGSHYSTIWLNEQVYSEIRRFVVISLNHGSTVCSPIHTYNKQATFKPNLPEVDQHAMIYTAKKAPQELITLDANGDIIHENLTIDPIQVIREQKDDEGELGEYARVNFSKIYTVENFVRVLNIGMVHPNSMDNLMYHARVKPRDTSPQPPKIHKKYSSSSSKDEKKSRNKEKGGKAKGSDKKKS